ncbi:MAG: peptidoglycan editing factor PgeF [Pseudomonadota bacterium]|jgi:YfiH family protein
MIVTLIQPNWAAPSNVQAFVTTRFYQGRDFNLATHVGDDLNKVLHNRQILREILSLPAEPAWLEQIHGCDACEIPLQNQAIADASYTSQKGQVCAILTADCLPILLCDLKGEMVAAIHAGWRGLVNGVIENCFKQAGFLPNKTLAYLGPAISQKAFEVGEEVREEFLKYDPRATAAFMPKQEKWLADLYVLATQRLNALGVSQIFGGQFCTFSQPELFYSYRRDKQTGRMASLIWLK